MYFCRHSFSEMNELIFKVNKETVTEGEIVEVTWSCLGATSVVLTLDNGFKAVKLDVENSGTKKFRLNRSKGKTKFVFVVTDSNGKSASKTLKVRVKELKAIKAEEVGGESRFTKFVRDYIAKTKRSWSVLSERKRMAYIVLWSVMLIMILSLINPIFIKMGLVALIAYMAWIVVKK